MSVHEWHNTTIGEKVVKELNKNRFDAHYFPERDEAINFILGFVENNSRVGFGGSNTAQELNLAEKAKEKGAVILDHNAPGVKPEEKHEIRRQQLISDLFICSSNAVTLDGYLVNVDGTGNRIAAMTFGPKKVVVVVGINKVVKDTHRAFERIQLIASPINNKRINLPNPCAESGYCMDCQGETRICNIYSVLKRKPSKTDISVVIIGESLGY